MCTLLYFIYSFLVTLGLRFCTWAFSSCGDQGWGVGSSLVHGFSALPCCRTHALLARALVAVVCRPTCSAACGIFPDQGLNLGPLHWQADSYPLRHQGSPWSFNDLCLHLPWTPRPYIIWLMCTLPASFWEGREGKREKSELRSDFQW